MSVQSTYNDKPAIAFDGQLADNSDYDAVTRRNDNASEIPFGVMVKQGTNDPDAEPVSAQADRLVGILIHSHAYAQEHLGTTGVKQDGKLSILRKGRIYVTPEEAVSPGDAVRVRATGTGTKGGFLSTAAVGETVDISDFASWATSGDASTPCILEVDMTNENLKSSD